MSVPRMRRVAPFDPTQISGCVLWLDANDNTTVTLSGSTVTQINDKSGNSNNTSSSTGTVTYAAGGLNSRPAFSFNATGGFRGPTSITGTTLTAFTVATLNSGVNYNGRLFGLANATQNDYAYATTCVPFFCLNGGPNISGYRNGYMGYKTNTFDTPFIGTSQFTGSSNSTSLNGTPGTAAADANGSFSITKYGFGCEGLSDAGVNWYGYCSEIILYNSLLSTAQQQQVEGYLAQKWGLRSNLPPGHPGITNTIYPIRNTLSMTPRSYAFTFTPTGIAGFGLWLDGSDPSANGSIPSNGSTVSTWKDKSGNGYDGTGNGTYSSSGSNIVFNNSSYSLPTGTFISGSGSYTIVSIQSTNNAGGIEYFFSFGSLGAPQHLSFPHVSPNPYLSWYGNDYNFTYSMTSGRSFIAINSYNISSNLKYGYVNGSLDGSLTPSTGRNTGTSPNTLGVGPNGYNLNGTLSEILIFSSFLTTTQQQQVEGYLAWKWALQSYLPESHPYKSASPNVTNPLNVTRQALPSILFPTPKTSSGIVTLYPSYTNTNGLISYFLFDNTIADTRNTITLTQTGSYSFVTGNRGQAIYLANEANISASTFSSNYLTSTYNFPSTFTVSLWFRTASSSPASAIFNTNRNPTYVQGSITLYYAGGNLYVAYTSVQNNGAGYAIAANTWYNAVVTYNSGTTYLYVNGSQSGSAVNLTPVVINQGFMLGGSADNGPVYPFAGYIEDFRIYNRVLSGSEITAIYNGTG